MRCLALACLLLVVGCDRVPIDPDGTSLLVTSPDLSVVLLEPDLRLRLVPDGISGPVTVLIDGTDIPFDSSAAAFLFEPTLTRGLNSFRVAVTSGTGMERVDTLYAVYLPLESFPLVDGNAGVARTDAAATALPDGRALVTGGRAPTGNALASADLLTSEPSRVTTSTVALRLARAGHTATLLEGGALLLGGIDAPLADGSSAFVRTPEWVGANGETRLVEIVNGPDGPARTGHATRLLTFEDMTYLYLLGGTVPAGTGTTVSSTVDIYRVDGGGGLGFRLERLSPPGGVSGFVPLTDIALASTSPRSGAAFGIGADGESTVALRWTTPGTSTSPFSFEARRGSALRTPRRAAATVELDGGITLILGGRTRENVAVGTLEVYAGSIDRTFRLPPDLQLRVPRSDHTATILNGSRIVVAGGRPTSGSAIAAYEAFQF